MKKDYGLAQFGSDHSRQPFVYLKSVFRQIGALAKPKYGIFPFEAR